MLKRVLASIRARVRGTCQTCRPRARKICRFVRRRLVWVLIICAIAAEVIALDPWLGATVIEIVQSGALTAGFILIGRLAWRACCLAIARFQIA